MIKGGNLGSYLNFMFEMARLTFKLIKCSLKTSAIVVLCLATDPF
jgi:hypothetical protein